jgi:hypothetical protein
MSGTRSNTSTSDARRRCCSPHSCGTDVTASTGSPPTLAVRLRRRWAGGRRPRSHAPAVPLIIRRSTRRPRTSGCGGPGSRTLQRNPCLSTASLPYLAFTWSGAPSGSRSSGRAKVQVGDTIGAHSFLNPESGCREERGVKCHRRGGGGMELKQVLAIR